MRFSEHTQLNKRWVHWLHKMTVKYHQKLQKNFYKSGNDDSIIDDIIEDHDASDNGQQMLQNSEERQKRWEEDTLKLRQAQRLIQNKPSTSS